MEVLPGIGHRQAAGGAVEQACAEVLLESRDMAGHGGIRGVEPLRRRDEAACLDHCHIDLMAFRRSMAAPIVSINRTILFG